MLLLKITVPYTTPEVHGGFCHLKRFYMTQCCPEITERDFISSLKGAVQLVLLPDCQAHKAALHAGSNVW